MKICVLGAGTWGIALAALLCANDHNVSVWSAIPSEIDNLVKNGTHPNLPDIILPKSIYYTKDIEEAAKDSEMILIVVPSSFVRVTTERLVPFLKDGQVLITAAKGIEGGSLMTMSEVVCHVLKSLRPELKCSVAALSGPTHAEEVAAGIPTSIVSACEDETVSDRIAEAFANSCMRVYTNTDVKGVEICGAMKNIIAIASGILTGMKLGDNTRAMLMTRGIAEITRLGLAMGCKRRTFMGLAGIGDLIVTCTSRHSRNNRCGELIGRGMTYEEASKEIGMVVEGYHALSAAMELSSKYSIELPITEAVHKIIKEGLSPSEAMLTLMTRDLKSELED
ncbi:MAG: NAD(P)-dependent glycerol-3-phosphate dehydrogenase [Clostridia bacterium]|nr:NAD(P)-dependent glycerol-3-phosphate dehydrogenase [Clostridia bacterium]